MVVLMTVAPEAQVEFLTVSMEGKHVMPVVKVRVERSQPVELRVSTPTVHHRLQPLLMAQRTQAETAVTMEAVQAAPVNSAEEEEQAMTMELPVEEEDRLLPPVLPTLLLQDQGQVQAIMVILIMPMMQDWEVAVVLILSTEAMGIQAV